MPDGHGLRSRTRDLFSKGYRQNGVVPTTDLLRTFKVGDYVDIKVNSAVHGGMPHKFYHGRTGVVWNITKRALGVEINKQVNGRIIKKRLHVRVEHVKPSRCREDFLKRRALHEDLKKQAKQKGERLPKHDLKRLPKQPREGFTLESVKMTTVAPIPYDVLKEGVVQ